MSEAAERFTASYYDGLSARHQDADVTLEPEGLRIAIAGAGSAYWPYRSIAMVEHLPAHGGWRLASREARDARLLVEDELFGPRLRAYAPRLKRAGAAPSTAAWTAVAIILAVLIASAAAIHFALPYAAGKIAAVIPEDLETALGDAAVAQLVGDASFCTNTQGAAALEALHRRLANSQVAATPMTIDVVAIDKVNAFAAPGGRIVLFEGLLRQATSSDEVAGVLAHEMGHVLARHPTRIAIQAMGAFTLASVLFGDLSAIADTAAQLGASLLVRAYGREAEQDADATALRLLAAAQISPRGLTAFFDRLRAKKGGDADGLASYFNSHPPLVERQQRAASADDSSTSPALDATAWAALRNICENAD